VPSSVTDILTRYAEIAMGLWTPETMAQAQKLKPYLTRQFILEWGLGLSPTHEQMNAGGLTDEDLISVGLLVKREKEDTYYPHFRDRIMIPHMEDGKVVYVTGRRLSDIGADGKKLSKQHKAISMYAPPRGVPKPDGFNLDLLKNINQLADNNLWIVEGPLDAARCSSLGQPAIAFGGGALEKNKGLIERLRTVLAHHVMVYVALDGTPDVTPERRVLAAGAVGPLVRICVLPEGLDPDDLDLKQIADLKKKAQTVHTCWVDGLEEWQKNGIDKSHWAHDNIKEYLVRWRQMSESHERKILDIGMISILGMTRDEYLAFVGENGKEPAPAKPAEDKTPRSPDGEPLLIDTGEGGGDTEVVLPDKSFDRKNNRPMIQNFTLKTELDDKGKEKTYKYAVPMPDIVQQMTLSLGGWPRSASGFLFAHEPNDKDEPVRVFEDTERMFGYFHSKATLLWCDGLDRMFHSLVGKKEYYVTLKDHVQRYDGVELCPHEPMLPNYYYAYEPDAEYTPDGSHFKKLLAYFDNVDTTNDRELVKAMFMTPMAGIPYDTRPAFAITAGTRNCGKSTLAQAVGELYGGYIDLRIKNRDTERDIFGRLLAPHNVVKRVARVDNIKGLCSSEELEAILTSPVINGHRFMKGDASRPNNITFILTGNALHLSTDIARRTFTIQLTSPRESTTWREELMSFIRLNRKRVFADIIAEMRKPKEEIDYSIGSGGWASWCNFVLSHVRDPNAILEATKERRVEVDEEVDEAASIMESIDEAVMEWNDAGGGFNRYPKYDIKPRFVGKERDVVFISSRDMAIILHKCFPNVNFSATMGTRWMRKHTEAKRLPRVEIMHTARERGYFVVFEPPIPEKSPAAHLPYD